MALVKKKMAFLAGNCTHALLTKREAKMAGYWPSSFIAFELGIILLDNEVHTAIKIILVKVTNVWFYQQS